jgi:signal transduction histidine kinase
VQFVEYAIDKAGLDILVNGVLAYGWIFEWGMFLFLLAAIGMAAWVFIDSTQKRKADKALAPRIMSLVGAFFILPAFIFRYTGTADGVTMKVRLLGEAGQPFYEGPIGWNVNWLMAGYGPKLALLSLLGVAISTLAVIIYASTVSRQRPSTEFISALNNQFGDLRQEIQSVKSRQPVPTSAQTMTPGGVAPTQAVGEPRRSAATVIDRPGRSSSTIIDRPGAGLAEFKGVSGTGAGQVWQLPASEIRVGRDASNFISLDDGKASREHAKVRFADGVYAVEDLGSANGTFVNERQISGQTPLADGDLVRVGDTVLAFKTTGA